MMFRSAMCPNCDSNIKLDADCDVIFCAVCGIKLQARDAFVYYDLKTGGATDIENIGSYSLLLKCGTEFLEQGKHDLAEACFMNIKYPRRSGTVSIGTTPSEDISAGCPDFC